MDRLTEFVLKAATVFSVYLILSISTASAVELSIYRQIASGNTATPTGEKVSASLDYSDKVSKTFDIVHDPADSRWNNVQVKIEVIGRDPLYPVSKIYLFRCKDSSPLDCVDYEPVEADSFLSGDKGTFYWSDVSRDTTAHFLTLVKFSHDGIDSWVGFWDEVERRGIKDFKHTSHDVSNLDIYAKPGIEPAWIKDFIETHDMIPANWVEKTVFGPVEGPVSQIYELVSDATEIDSLSFGRYKPPGNMVKTTVKDYLIALAKGSTANPITFFANQLPVCGENGCEVGENSENCCLDCGCPSDGQTCDATEAYPSGQCHVCGDGTPDAVENSTNCCIDAGCPEGLYCNTDMNVPYGQCVTPQCGNQICEAAEDSSTCPGDCWNTPGKTCADAYGTGYYYDQTMQRCTKAECGENGCEPGETPENCCLDCGCPSGEYCETGNVAAGVCTAPTCGNNECEPGEDYTNCCTDCNDCPADTYTGQLQVCTDNVCHLCGNGHIESPIETQETCCQDTGCNTGYCSVRGSCKESGMGITAVMLPSTLDCTQTGSDVEVKFTLVKGPAFVDEFKSVTYMFENGRYTLSDCQQQSDAYLCRFPISGPNSFQGCFDTGTKNLNFSVVISYFDDRTAKDANEVKYAELTTDLDVEVTKARLRSCNKDGSCDAGMGETPDYCCWDCGCEANGICTASGCIDESQISLTINPEDLPSKNNIDCSPSNTQKGDFTFRSHVQNVPESAIEPFRLINWKLLYDGKTYTAQNIPGFSCTALTDSTGHHTGDVECTMPVSLFPACPDEPPANMDLVLNVLGGGLSAYYPIYEGKNISDDFNLEYVSGLPMCGNGEPNPELGETQQTCCQDMGCPDGEVCTVDASCISKDELDLIVKTDPQTVDCSAESADSIGRKQVKFTATANHMPYSPESNGLEFGDVFIDDRRVGGELYGTCSPLVNSTSYSVYSWECSMPVSQFNPFCWEAKDYKVDYETSIAWFDKAGNRQTKDITKTVSFTIDPARGRQCVIDGACNADIGENTENCCADCGCAGEGNVCTASNECVDENTIGMKVTVTSNALNCQATSSNDDGSELTFDVTMQNLPHNTQFIKWYMTYNGQTFSTPYFTCEQEVDDIDGSPTGTYKCTMPIRNFPACTIGDGETANFGLEAKIYYMDYSGRRHKTEISHDFSVTVGKSGLPLCGNGECNSNLGETSDNCCEDCPCTDSGKICAAPGQGVGDTRCINPELVTLRVSPGHINTKCTLSPGNLGDVFDSGEDYTKNFFMNKWGPVILDYSCTLDEPVKVDVKVNHMPAGAVATDGTFVWSEVPLPPRGGFINNDKLHTYHIMNTEQTADGWTLSLMPNMDNSLVVDPVHGKTKVLQTTITDITLNIQSVTPQGGTKSVTASSSQRIGTTITAVKNDGLLDYESGLKKVQKSMKKANTLMCLIASVMGLCVACSLMSGKVSNGSPEMPKGLTTDQKNSFMHANSEWDSQLAELDKKLKSGDITKEDYEFEKSKINEFWKNRLDEITKGTVLENTGTSKMDILEQLEGSTTQKTAKNEPSGTSDNKQQTTQPVQSSSGRNDDNKVSGTSDNKQQNMKVVANVKGDSIVSDASGGGSPAASPSSLCGTYKSCPQCVNAGCAWDGRVGSCKSLSQSDNFITDASKCDCSGYESCPSCAGAINQYGQTCAWQSVYGNCVEKSSWEIGITDKYDCAGTTCSSWDNDCESCVSHSPHPQICMFDAEQSTCVDYNQNEYNNYVGVDERYRRFKIDANGCDLVPFYKESVSGGVTAAPVTGMQIWDTGAGVPYAARYPRNYNPAMMMPGGGIFGGIPMNMFTQMSNEMKGFSMKQSKTSGIIAGGLFMLGEMTVMKCDPYFWGAVGGGTLVCALAIKNPKAAQTMAKTCDTIAAVAGLLQILINMQSGMQSYQACMASAQLAMTQRTTSSQNAYDLGMRTTRYYKQMQQCQAQLTQTIDRLSYDLSVYNYQRMAQQEMQETTSEGGQTSAVEASPKCDNSNYKTSDDCIIGPNNPQFRIDYTLPVYGMPNMGMYRVYDPHYPQSHYLYRNYFAGRTTYNRFYTGAYGRSYGYIRVTYQYRYIKDDGTAGPGSTISRDFKIRNNHGSINCYFDRALRGLTCDSTNGDIPQQLPGTCYVPGCDSNARVTGTISVNSYLSGDSYPIARYRFDTGGQVAVNIGHQTATEEEQSEQETECNSIDNDCYACVDSGCKYVPGHQDDLNGHICVKDIPEGVDIGPIDTITTKADCDDYYLSGVS